MRLQRTLQFAFVVALFSTGALAAGPDTSTRSWVDYLYQNSNNNILNDSPSTYVGATAAANNDQYALLGAGLPSLKISLTCTVPLFCNIQADVEYEANPVYVIGPWDGSVSSTRLITPPTNPLGIEEFGSALAIQGSRIAVGAPLVFSWSYTLDTTTFEFTVTRQATAGGRVHLYQSNNSAITFEQTVVLGGLNERFGESLALDDDHLLVARRGATPGAADIFNPDTGALITSLVSPGTNDGFAKAVALAGDLAIVAAPDIDTVYMYRHDGSGNWNSAGTLDSPGSNSEFGFSIAADGDSIIVGAPGTDRAYIFEDNGDTNWPVVAQLSGSATSRFGTAVAITGETAFISAPELLFLGIRTGFVARHEKGDGSWPFTGSSISRQPHDGDQYGKLISASSTMLTVLEPGSDEQQPNEYNIFTAPDRIWDTDGDQTVQFLDNCPNVTNINQQDFDEDGLGNACDIDGDNDGLLNPDENAIGSDPFNPDTDGDGMLDGEDPDPLVSDLDRDGVGDDDEIAAGTDPLDADTDDDGREDGEDPYPLDPFDGWLLLEQLDIPHQELALGSDLLLVLKNDNNVQAMTRPLDDWITIVGPTMDGLALPEVRRMSMSGTRAVFVERNNTSGLDFKFHVFDYDSGWTWLGSGNTSSVLGGITSITRIAIDGDTIAATVSAGGTSTLILFDVTPGGITSVATNPTSNSGPLVVAGDTAFASDLFAYGGEGSVTVYESANSYVPQEIQLPLAVRDTSHRFGQDLSPTGPNQVLVGSELDGFWLEKIAGNWTLTQLGIPQPPDFFAYRDYWVGGGGNRRIVTHGRFDWLVYSGVDETSLGELRPTSNRPPLTNGDILVRTSNQKDFIEVYHPIIQPPGC